ncbi:SRPBCC family protein [Geomonas paludis]|uniref:SRPBCC domain-containing protein n=1 Tax=Geomonas paludis TaxID=2740185 RepID=A0A6V8MV50_9BACT|nr:SRPBCC family protein [Geomonas paludis]UPU37373.1 SRPBCC family protein [Geomonas paludis]GFO64065.1 SRPBCC domain-containing protein [Geomonas paludis]
MKMYLMKQEQLLPLSPEQAWEFFVHPGNLPRITPPNLGFKITGELPDKMHAGMIVTYTVTPFLGMAVNWVTEITHMQEPYFFVDEQRFGPYRMWHHQHIFTETPQGTLMTDLVHYVLPFGPLGRVAAPLVARRVRGIFDYRREALARELGFPV